MAFTTLSAAGAKDRASERNAAITELRPVAARKSTNETVNNSSALQADDELFVSVEGSRIYAVDLHIFYTSGTTPDFKWQFTAPSGATFVWGATYYDTAAAMASGGNFTLATVGQFGGTGADVHGAVYGTLVTAASAGTFALTWAQNSANLSNTTLYAGSYLLLTLLS